MSSWQGDFAPLSVVHFTFTTVNTTGVPTTLSGNSPAVAVWQNALSSAVQSGVTTVVNFASTVGLNMVSIDTSANTTFYAGGNNFNVAVVSGFVGATSIIGYSVGSFSLNNRSIRANVVQWSSATVAVPATAGIPDVNAKNIANATAATSLASGNVNVVSFNGTSTVTSLALGNVNLTEWLGSAPAVLAGPGGNLVQTIVSGAASSNVNVVQWNGVGVSGTVPPDAVFIQSAAAQSGSSSTTITLVSGAAGTNNYYNGELIFLRSGLGSGQSAIITSYNATTKVATINPGWAVNPSGGDNYTIQAFAEVSTIQQSNVLQIGGVVVATSTAQFGVNVIQYNSQTAQTDGNNLPKVDAEDIKGTASAGTAGSVGIDWAQVSNKTATVDLSNTTIKNLDGTANASVTQWNGVPVAGSLPPDSIFTPGQAAATLQSGSSATTVTLASGSSNITDFYKFQAITLKSGLGIGQTAIITNYNAATKVAILNSSWAQNPSGGDAYFLIGEGQAVSTTSGVSNVNVTQWAGGAVPAPNVTGEPLVDVNHWRGTQPNTLVSNRVDSSVGNMQAGVIVATVFGAGAMTTVAFATNFLTGALIDPTGGNTIADDLLDRANAIETGVTPRQAWRYVSAAEAGVTAGALTTTFTIAAIGNNGTNRITATTTASGNRTAVTLN